MFSRPKPGKKVCKGGLMSHFLIHYLPMGIAIILILLLRSGSISHIKKLSEESRKLLDQDSDNLRKQFYLLLFLSISPVFLKESGLLQSRESLLGIFGMGFMGGVLYGFKIPRWTEFLRRSGVNEPFIKNEILHRSVHSILIISMNIIELIKITGTIL